MDKIASPQDLQAELNDILASCQGDERPSREVIAADLRDLADRVAGMEATQVKALIKTFKADLARKLYGLYPDASPAKTKSVAKTVAAAATAAFEKAEKGLSRAKHIELK